MTNYLLSTYTVITLFWAWGIQQRIRGQKNFRVYTLVGTIRSTGNNEVKYVYFISDDDNAMEKSRVGKKTSSS